MKTRFFLRFDYLLVFLILLLVFFGVLFIYSSSIDSVGVSVTNEYLKQIVWALFGIGIMVFFTLYDYRRTEHSIAKYSYFVLIFVLVYTLIFGKHVNGAKSWIGIGDFGIQPSEFGKIVFIMFLARYLNSSQMENPLPRFIKAGIIMCIPMGLILIQPDMGTASVYIPIFLIMCFFAGIPVRYIVYVLSIGVLSILFCILPVWNTEIAKTQVPLISVLTVTKLRALLILTFGLIALLSLIVRRYFQAPKYAYWISYFFSIVAISLILSLVLSKVLKFYQIKRLIVFLDPNTDPLGSGWNIIQSKIAIGAGGLFGQSYLHGTQSHYRFLPQQSTDFIFSILSEEWGFIGGFVVFTIYLIIMLRILSIIKQTKNSYGVLIASGIFAMFAFHFFINVGMVMGIMPITGIPLVFLSYGGSSLLTGFMCIGVLMSINSRKKELA